MVRAPGVEPGRHKRRILSPLGLPIPPYSQLVSLLGFEPRPHGPKPWTLPGYAIES